MKTDVLIIGGGVSGLAAAVKLTESNLRVTLVESSGKLGGRTYSFQHRETGDIIDNGQHILVGAYKHTLEYLQKIGTLHLLTSPKKNNINFWSRHCGVSSLTFSPHLPQSLSLLTAIANFKSLTINDKLRLLRIGNCISHLQKYEQRIISKTVDEWLDEFHQSAAAKENFWHPLALAVMNEEMHRASALLFAGALQQTLFSTPANAQILFPSVGQTELYVQKAEELFQRKNIMVKKNTHVVQFELNENSIQRVLCKNEDAIEATSIISCVPAKNLYNVLNDSGVPRQEFQGLSCLQSSAIITVYLWFNTIIMQELFMGVGGKTIQWIFNRNKILHTVHHERQCLAVVISGANELLVHTRDELVTLCHKELSEIFPQIKFSELLYSFVIKERHATFSATPGNEKYRMDTVSSIKNMYVAGDWTNTKLPATIEGAIKSGVDAAQKKMKEKSNNF